MLSDLETSKKECQLLKQNLDASKKQARDLQGKIASHNCKSECDCEKIQRENANKCLAAEEELDTLRKQLDSQRCKTESLENDIVKRTNDSDKMRLDLHQTQTSVQDLQKQLEQRDKDLEESREEIQQLMQQIESSSDTKSYIWKDVVSDKVVLVKGENNPLSNFYPCPMHVFGQEFASAEHSYQTKKCLDNDLYEAADIIKSQPTAKLSKSEADRLVPTDVSDNWESKSLPLMRYLLRTKKDSCNEFVESLMKTGNRKIVHNVASSKWGAGKDGAGENVFGMLLMELRDELRSSHKHAQDQKSTLETSGEQTGMNVPISRNATPPPKKPETFATTSKKQSSSSPTMNKKPSVLILGNSHIDGIRSHKLSQNFTTSKRHAYTLEEAHSGIDKIASSPDAIILQLTTNEAKSNCPLTKLSPITRNL